MQLERRRRPILAAVAATLLALVAVGSGPGAAPASAAEPLVGTFRITAGSCRSAVSGSYFRMILPTGTVQDGPRFENSDSTCSDKSYTPLTPGTDGGLVTGAHQPAPTPGFDENGNSLSDRVIRPVTFVGVKFATSTNPRDLQTGTSVPAPSLSHDAGRLSGDLSSFAATWNKQAFNQGAPKPDGSVPALTSRPTGTFDAATGRYSLTWTSTIVGGPFDKFTGQWHLEGTFVPATSSAPGTGGTGGTGGTTATTVASGGPSATVPAGGGTRSTIAPAGDAPEVSAPSEDVEEQAAAAIRVEDEGFEAPVWLVLLLAALGIGGVVALLLLGARPSTSGGGA